MFSYGFTYEDLEYFLLIFVRVTSFVYIVPFFNMGNVPGRVRVILSFFTSILLYSAISPRIEVVYHTLLGYSLIVAKEFAVGLLLGMGVNLCMTILSMTGAVADMEVGFSMVQLMDPATRTQTTITSTMYQYLVVLLLIISGMYEYVFGALAESFLLIPINGAIFHTDRMMKAALFFLAEYLSIGFRICLPIFAAILMLNVILGVMAKLTPQMNMFAIGLQLKIFVGLGIIFLTLPLLPLVSDLIFTEVKKMTVMFVQTMR